MRTAATRRQDATAAYQERVASFQEKLAKVGPALEAFAPGPGSMHWGYVGSVGEAEALLDRVLAALGVQS